MGYFGFTEYEFALDDDPMLPLEAIEFDYYGLPAPLSGNDGHPSDYYDSLEAEVAIDNMIALYYALTRVDASRDNDGLINVVSGHTHLDEAMLLAWRPLWVWSPANGLGAATTKNGYAIVNSTAFVEVGWGLFLLPPNLTRRVVYPRICGTTPGPGTATTGALQVRFTIFGALGAGSADLAAAPLADPLTLVLWGETAFGQSDRWIEGEPITLSQPTAINGERVCYAKLEARVTAGEAALIGAAIGLRGGP